jgi:hypothetical protein
MNIARYYIFICIILFAGKAFGQQSNINQYQPYFSRELRDWVNTYKNFRLSEFKRKDSLPFENGEKQDFRKMKAFMSIHKRILTFSADSTRFIDIYSDQLHISKEGNHYVANPDDGGAVFLCDKKSRYWNRVCYNSMGQWIEEAIWISKTKFILAGIWKNKAQERMPLILVGDVSKQTLYEYTSSNNSCSQTVGYDSPKLKRMKIQGF